VTATPSSGRTTHLLCISAHDETAFRRRADTLADRLATVAAEELNDTCFTLHTSGEHHSLRTAVVGKTGGELADALRRAGPRKWAGRDHARVALMFTGQGSQYPGMGRGLYATEPAFRTAFDAAAACFGSELGASLQALVFDGKADAARLAETDLTQPAVFAVDYAIGRLLLDWGVQPHCMMGHSVGEYAAACLANVLALPAAARLVRERGRLMRELPTGGGMIAVFASADQVLPLLEPVRDRAFIAAYNGAHVVVAGVPSALEELAPRLDGASLVHRRLAVSQAFHTPLLKPMSEAFRRAFDGVAIHKPSVTLISNVTGEVVDSLLDADYWVRHVLEPVRFEQSVQTALRHRAEVFVEAGPDRVLSEMCRGLLGTAAVAVPTLHRKGEDTSSAVVALGELFVRGAHVDFGALHGPGARRVRGLPPYPLGATTSLGRPGIAKHAPGAVVPQPQAAAAAKPPAPAALTAAIWSWTVETPRWRAAPGPGRLLVVAPERLRPQLERTLGRAGDRWLLVDPTVVAPSTRAAKPGAKPSAIDVSRFAAATRGDRPIAGVLYLLAGWTGHDGGDPAWDDGVELGVHGVVALAKALGESRGAVPVPFVLATRGAMAVLPDDVPSGAWQSPAIAVVQGLSLEEPSLDARAIDLGASASDEAVVRTALDELSFEPGEERIAAIRAGQRLARTLCLAPALDARAEPWQPKDGETYLLTGAASGIGADIALHIAKRARVQLVLTGRRPLAPPGSPPSDAESAERARVLQALEQTGARVRYEAVDVTDRAAMADVVRRTRAAFGPIHGVVHCAGVVDGTSLKLTGKTSDALWRVLSPKVRGVEVLDDVTRQEPLRFFTVFSSASASRIAWSRCQADYVAANFFLDQYCFLRASRGGPGRSVAINWALWRATGMARGAVIESIAEGLGLEAIEPEAAVRMFDELVVRDQPVLHVLKTLNPVVLRAPALEPVAPGPAPVGEDEVHDAVFGVLGEQLGLPASAIDGAKTFRELGLDSAAAVDALRKLEAKLHRKLYPTLFFEFKTAGELARHLAGSAKPGAGAAQKAPTSSATSCTGGPSEATGPCATVDSRDIAIVGMACRLPGAPDPEAFWELLCSGKSMIGEAPAHRFDADASFDATGATGHTSYSRWGAFVDEAYGFDAMFFGISPREAICMDPQQRMFLEVTWQAIQRAGYGRERPTDVGVFVGCEGNAYGEHFTNSLRHGVIVDALARAPWFQALAETARANMLAMLAHHLAPAEITADVAAGNGLNEIAARVSHFLDARGPSFVLGSACSSSLVALHYACESLRRGETSMAIAGGVFLNFGTAASVFLSKLKALSPTGECRPFDHRANGMVLGEGAAAFVLKPLAAALRDRDHVHAVIKGSAVNNDGHSSGITVPTIAGQAEVIRRAYRDSGVDPATVSYVECHGTATPLGDPIEIQGLAQSIGAARSTPCTLGSAKGAVGHALAAAGACSVLKVAMALEARSIPPTAGYTEPTQHVDFGPFNVAHGAPRPWESDGPRRAGVNAFGFGGTNCHLILEEAPPVAAVKDTAGSHLLCLYGRTPEALRRWAGSVKRSIEARPEISLGATCGSLDQSQRQLANVAACVVRDRAELLAALESIAADRDRPGLHRGKTNPRRTPKLVLALGTEWLPSRGDAEALATSSPRLAKALADALAALRDERQPERAGLLSQYVVARALEELGVRAGEIVGEGQAAAVAACLRKEITVSELAGAAHPGATPAAPDVSAKPAPGSTLILALGAPLAFIAGRGLGSVPAVHAGRSEIARPWALDLLARLQAQGAFLAVDALHDERPVHVPLADSPFDRTTYKPFNDAPPVAAPPLASPTRAAAAPLPRSTPNVITHSSRG
jgi:acyl transferase domain-containing protein/acyl carrier protein